MLLIEFVGKFYDNHSLSIVNRNILKGLIKRGERVRVIPIDSFNPKFGLSTEDVKMIKDAEKAFSEECPNVQLRHCYPPLWRWPEDDSTKVVFIQPWEFTKVPFEWQYKFEQFADALIVPSNYTANIFLEGGLDARKLHVVPNGYDDSIFNKDPGGQTYKKYGIKEEKFNFMYVGNAQWRKGLDLLLNVWPRVFKRSDNAKLIIKDNPNIYGKSNVIDQILRLQYYEDCAEIIYIEDDLSDREMADLYKVSKVIVHPYRAEGFGMHIQEAVACGCYPIIPNVGPTEEFIPDDIGARIDTRRIAIDIQDRNIFATKPGDAMSLMGSHTFANEPNPSSLGQAMFDLYQSHSRQEKLDKVKEANLANTWDSVVDSYISILKNISQKEANRVL